MAPSYRCHRMHPLRNDDTRAGPRSASIQKKPHFSEGHWRPWHGLHCHGKAGFLRRLRRSQLPRGADRNASRRRACKFAIMHAQPKLREYATVVFLATALLPPLFVATVLWIWPVGELTAGRTAIAARD